MQFTKPVIFFDLETTGTDTSKDKPVSFAAIKINTDPFGTNEEERVNIIINPGMIIPEGATAVHGITNAMVQGAKTFKEVANELYAYFRGCDIAGYNILNFDVPMLAECFQAEGYTFPEADCKIFDAYKIFAHFERRDLTGAAKFYLNESHDGAHDALADVLMTQKVMMAQLNKYDELQSMDADKLHTFCMGENSLDYAGKLVKDKDGFACYNFGKYKGTRVIDEKGYGFWMLTGSFPENTKAILRQLLGVK